MKKIIPVFCGIEFHVTKKLLNIKGKSAKIYHFYYCTFHLISRFSGPNFVPDFWGSAY